MLTCMAGICGVSSKARQVDATVPPQVQPSLSDLPVKSTENFCVASAVSENIKTDKRVAPTLASLDLSVLLLNYDPRRPFNRMYKTLDKLGAGAFGAVFKVKHHNTGEVRAMKLLKKTEVKEDMALVSTEIEAMVRLDHPNIVKFFEFFEDGGSISIVTELCNGGDFSRLQGGQAQDLQPLFRDVMMGVAYCHDRGVVHRDLKFENCLITLGGCRRIGKVIDFGLSAIRRPSDGEGEAYLMEALGTKYFVAPEVIDNSLRYGSKCDLWSMGVMLYILLTKEHPFAAEATKMPTKALFQKILREHLRVGPLDRAHATRPAVDLVRKLLKKSPKERIDAAAALDETWLRPATSNELDITKCVSKRASTKMIERLLTFHEASRFEKTVRLLVAHQQNLKMVEEMRAAFVALDTHADGSLTIEELKAGMASCNYEVNDEELHASFEAMDLNSDEKINYSEWLGATLDAHVMDTESVVKELFHFFDQDGNGSVSLRELREVIGDSEATRILHDADESKDGNIQWDEFKHLMHNIAEMSAAKDRDKA